MQIKFMVHNEKRLQLLPCTVFLTWAHLGLCCLPTGEMCRYWELRVSLPRGTNSNSLEPFQARKIVQGWTFLTVVGLALISSMCGWELSSQHGSQEYLWPKGHGGHVDLIMFESDLKKTYIKKTYLKTTQLGAALKVLNQNVKDWRISFDERHWLITCMWCDGVSAGAVVFLLQDGMAVLLWFHDCTIKGLFIFTGALDCFAVCWTGERWSAGGRLTEQSSPEGSGCKWSLYTSPPPKAASEGSGSLKNSMERCPRAEEGRAIGWTPDPEASMQAPGFFSWEFSLGRPFSRMEEWQLKRQTWPDK